MRIDSSAFQRSGLTWYLPVRLQLLAAQLANRGRRDRQAGKELWGQKTNRAGMLAAAKAVRRDGTIGHVLVLWLVSG